MRAIVWDTAHRVQQNTAPQINDAIRREMHARVRCLAEDPDAIDQRLEDLDQEWDIERAIEANASTLALTGLCLGAFVSRWFLLLPAVVLSFLLQHALQGWCPPVPILRRLGVRTAGEIEAERYALKAVRGDFERLGERPERRGQQVLQALER